MRLFRPAGRAARDVHEHDRQTAFAERVGQRARPAHDVAQRVNDGQAREALLQVDDDQGGVRIEPGECHERSFQGTPSVVDQPLEQRDGGREFILFPCCKPRLDGPAEPVLARRASLADQLPAGVGEREEGLPAVRRIRRAATRPASSSAAMTGAIDWGRMPSARARLDAVAAPSFSRRSRTDTWEGVRSPTPACSRRRRLSLPNRARRPCARTAARRA